MSRRIDLELTSTRPDGSWTWRAAGARQPKGELDGSILPDGAKVGDVLRAEADFDVDGITILSIVTSGAKARKEPERIEIIGTPSKFEPVSTTLVPKSERGRGERRDRPGRGDRPDRPRGERGERGDKTRGERAGGRGERSGRPERGPRPEGRDRRPRPAPEAPAPKPKAKRLNPASTHRDAVLATLTPEQKPVAEQVLRGGIPAVRQAVEQQNQAAKAEGKPTIKPDALVAMAEEMLPRLKAAEWRDRAEAAAADVDEISLRDLRSVVTGSDVARDDETRALATRLREALERRTTEQRERWLKEVTTALDENRVVRALRIASRAPDPGSRIPAEVAGRLATAAGEAMTADIAPDRWATLLDAVASSPVRLTVKPAGFPAEPGEDLLKAAKQASGRVPALASLLGITMPPPPGPPRKARPPKPPRPAAAPKPAAAEAPAAPEAPSAPEQATEASAPDVAAAAPSPTEPAETPQPETPQSETPPSETPRSEASPAEAPHDEPAEAGDPAGATS